MSWALGWAQGMAEMTQKGEGESGEGQGSSAAGIYYTLMGRPRGGAEEQQRGGQAGLSVEKGRWAPPGVKEDNHHNRTSASSRGPRCHSPSFNPGSQML